MRESWKGSLLQLFPHLLLPTDTVCTHRCIVLSFRQWKSWSRDVYSATTRRAIHKNDCWSMNLRQHDICLHYRLIFNWDMCWHLSYWILFLRWLIDTHIQSNHCLSLREGSPSTSLLSFLLLPPDDDIYSPLCLLYNTVGMCIIMCRCIYCRASSWSSSYTK